jgi:hypothetical protein
MTGLTLHAATVVIFAELFWNPSSLLQCGVLLPLSGSYCCLNVNVRSADPRSPYPTRTNSGVCMLAAAIQFVRTVFLSFVCDRSYSPRKPEPERDIHTNVVQKFDLGWCVDIMLPTLPQRTARTAWGRLSVWTSSTF